MNQKNQPLTSEKKSGTLESAQNLMAVNVMRPMISEKDSDFECAAKALFKPSWSLQPADRLEIYNKQYWYRILDSMLEDFPGVQSIIGAERFDALVMEYVKTYPSITYSLRDLGYKFSEFIDSNSKFTEPDQNLVWQIARFEWAAIEAFDRKRYPTIPPNALGQGDPESLIMVLQPYLTLLEIDYALDDFAIELDKSSAQHGVSTAQANRSHDETGSLRPKKKHLYLAIHRLQNHVYYKRIDREQYQLLNSMKSGLTIGQSCEKLASSLTPKKLAGLATRLQKYFSDWMELGWFADPTSMKQ